MFSLSFIHSQALLKHLPCQGQGALLGARFSACFWFCFIVFFGFGFGFLHLVSISFSHIQFLNPYFTQTEKPFMVGFYQMVS